MHGRSGWTEFFTRNMILWGHEIRLAGIEAIHHQLNVGLLAIHYQAYCECSLIDGTGAVKPWLVLPLDWLSVYGDHCHRVTDRSLALPGIQSIISVIPLLNSRHAVGKFINLTRIFTIILSLNDHNDFNWNLELAIIFYTGCPWRNSRNKFNTVRSTDKSLHLTNKQCTWY